ncbi:TRAM LAG1 CLN8 homology domain-containing [Lecanosticta acicola]|uniref:TRAM LAG1 CLN8 homology domain-containing n=1 Tax=Lecanosticta acicola TaxID=111012 RepID=A0AAI8Z1E5_9PEZI|nr:TRAM LAG1 CLN8 homology domain-containing [Lecanosticta acicola]
MDPRPVSIVSLATAAYSALLAGAHWASIASPDTETNLKGISDVHSLISSTAALYALSKRWPHDVQPKKHSASYLDDSNNPLIVGKSDLGNAITSWETGYLLFDTAVKLLSHWQTVRAEQRVSLQRMPLAVLRREPLILFHHFALLGGLAFLQVYIAKGRERGVWIIVAFILMNASTPVMHWRWRQRQRTGRTTLTADVLLALVFGASRLGLVGWVLKQYADYHGIGAWDAFQRQRGVCRTGTAVLFGMNAVWEAALLKRIAGRIISSWNS